MKTQRGSSVMEILVDVLILELFLLMIWVGIFAVTAAKADRDCLAAGYPIAKVDFLMTAYCVQRTDVVVPLSKVKP